MKLFRGSSSKNMEQGQKTKRLVVIGAGPGGASMAKIADAAGFQVTVIERRAGLIWKPGGPLAVIDPEWALTKGLIPLRGIVSGPNSERIQDDVTKLDAESKKVFLSSGRVLDFDYAVIAVGARNLSPADPPPTVTSFDEIKKHYEDVNTAIRAAKSIVVVGAGAVGIEIAGSIRNELAVPITLVHAGSAPAHLGLPGAPSAQMLKFQVRLSKLLKEANIGLVLSARVTNMSVADCPAGYKAASAPFPVTLSSGETLQADLVLWCAGSVSNAPHILPASALDERSRLVKVDSMLRVRGMADVFAIGDCTDVAEPKLAVVSGSNHGSAMMPQGHADYVLKNLLSLANGRAPSVEYPALKSMMTLVPVTKKVGGAGIGIPNFLAGLKGTRLEWFAPMWWKSLNAGKFGKEPVKSGGPGVLVRAKSDWARKTPQDLEREQAGREEARLAAVQSAQGASEAVADDANEAQLAALMSAEADSLAEGQRKPRIAIVFYSMYGHVAQLAAAEKLGVEEAGGEATLLQLPETLSAEVLAKMHAPPKPDVPLAEVAELPLYDGFLFGLPGRYGQAPAQFKAFWDATGQIWAGGQLTGKPAGTFFSTGGQGGGQETIALTLLPQLVHHGMVYVPLGYQDKRAFDNTEVHGASPYGAGTIANGDGSRQPSALELGIAQTQGRAFTQVAKALMQ